MHSTIQRQLALAALLVMVGAAPAFAHITVAPAEVPAGSTIRAVFQVPHGCDGAPTTAIRVRIPEGLIGVKPQPKPGWTLETVTAPYAKSYTLYGTPVSEGVTEVRWSGGSLPDAFYDEFLLRGTFAANLAAGQTVYFPVIQECGDASEDWIAIPVEGQPEPDLPAPGVTLTTPTP